MKQRKNSEGIIQQVQKKKALPSSPQSGKDKISRTNSQEATPRRALKQPLEKLRDKRDKNYLDTIKENDSLAVNGLLLNSSPVHLNPHSPVGQSSKAAPVSSRNEVAKSGLNLRNKEASLDSIVNTGAPLQDSRVQVVKPDLAKLRAHDVFNYASPAHNRPLYRPQGKEVLAPLNEDPGSPSMHKVYNAHNSNRAKDSESIVHSSRKLISKKVRGPVVPVRQHEFFNSMDRSLNDVSMNSNENRSLIQRELRLPAIKDNRARIAPIKNQQIEMQ